ncbi:MAG: tetratricopeptide repeat protein [Candidatus Melainabacteria bacterium]|nr:MAG: tetratricopeptide repeat protein [Candidatus Melainabacteria bacterium]
MAALSIIQENVGPEHASVAKAIENLAHLYEDQENFEEADRLYRWSLGLCEKTLGVEHPEVAALMAKYASLQKKMVSDDEDTDLLWNN